MVHATPNQTPVSIVWAEMYKSQPQKVCKIAVAHKPDGELLKRCHYKQGRTNPTIGLVDN